MLNSYYPISTMVHVIIDDGWLSPAILLTILNHD